MKNNNNIQLATEKPFPDAELIYTFDQISVALQQLAENLNRKMSGTNPVVLCVMNGALVFCGHLLTRLNFQCELDYVHASRYANSTQGDTLEWVTYPVTDLQNRTVLLLDDILDEGITLKAIEEYCYSQGACHVEKAILFHKKHDRCCIELSEDSVALAVDDRYVFGFGMDYEGSYRYLDSIYALKEAL